MNKTFFFIILYTSLLLLNSCKKDSVEPSGYDQEILDMINVHRADLSLSPLVQNDFIWQIANEHSAAMAEGSVPFGHDSFTERSERIRAEFGLGATAENIAWGQGTAEEVVNGWLASVGHKANMEGNYTLTGLSAVRSKDGTWYYTQIFYKKN